jgi:hypothetical protein
MRRTLERAFCYSLPMREKKMFKKGKFLAVYVKVMFDLIVLLGAFIRGG